jgi:hypothetical protein
MHTGHPPSAAPILAILDEGLRLYRRHFAHFALLATLGVRRS